MDLCQTIVFEVADILDARDMDHTMANRFQVLAELQADRFDVFVYSHAYHEMLTRLMVATADDSRQLV